MSLNRESLNRDGAFLKEAQLRLGLDFGWFLGPVRARGARQGMALLFIFARRAIRSSVDDDTLLPR